MRKKILGAIILGGLIYLGLTYFGLAPGLNRTESVVPQIVDLSGTPDVTPETSGVAITIGALPGTKPASLRTPPVKITMYPWTAELGILFATGGPQTTEGSLMAKHNVNLRL